MRLATTVVLVGGLSGCFCIDFSSFSHQGAGGGNATGGGGGSTETEFRPNCAYDEITPEGIARGQALSGPGEASLSDAGCIVLRLSTKGATSTAEIVRDDGVAFDTTANKLIEMKWVDVRVETTATTKTWSFLESDGGLVRTITTTRNASGAFVERVETRSDFSEVAKTTISADGPKGLKVVRVMTNGTTESWASNTLQPTCNKKNPSGGGAGGGGGGGAGGGGGGGGTTPPQCHEDANGLPFNVGCTAEQTMRIQKLIQQAGAKGAACLHESSPVNGDAAAMVASQIKFTPICTDDPCIAAATDTTNPLPDGTFALYVNTVVLQPGQNPAEVSGTIWHELLHYLLPPHDKLIEELSDRIFESDPVYGCEKLCFSSNPTVCHWAACFQSKTCYAPSSLDSCRGQNIGALCTEANQEAWCTTLAECNGACSKPCRSYSVSCDKSCK